MFNMRYTEPQDRKVAKPGDTAFRVDVFERFSHVNVAYSEYYLIQEDAASRAFDLISISQLAVRIIPGCNVPE